MAEQMKIWIDAMFKLGDWINTYLMFYGLLIIAVIGWVNSSLTSWGPTRKGIAIFAFGLIATINLISAYRAMKLVRLALGEIKSIVADDQSVIRTENLRGTILRSKYPDPKVILIVHIVLDVLVV